MSKSTVIFLWNVKKKQRVEILKWRGSTSSLPTTTTVTRAKCECVCVSGSKTDQWNICGQQSTIGAGTQDSACFLSQNAGTPHSGSSCQSDLPCHLCQEDLGRCSRSGSRSGARGNALLGLPLRGRPPGAPPPGEHHMISILKTSPVCRVYRQGSRFLDLTDLPLNLHELFADGVRHERGAIVGDGEEPQLLQVNLRV